MSHEHCKHYESGAPHPGEEPYGDPGDGLGVEGYCCQCDAENDTHYYSADCELCTKDGER